MAGLRQSDAAAVARNEPRVQILLQGLDLLPDGSAGKTEMPGGGIQAAQSATTRKVFRKRAFIARIFLTEKPPSPRFFLHIH